jgi:threonine dehydrogenase-like Zn-dependent dehydrogenase
MALGFIPDLQFNLKLVTFKAARIMGSMGGTGQFETVLDFTRTQPDIARQLITHQVPFTDFHQAFALAADRKNAMKVLIKF